MKGRATEWCTGAPGRRQPRSVRGKQWPVSIVASRLRFEIGEFGYVSKEGLSSDGCRRMRWARRSRPARQICCSASTRRTETAAPFRSTRIAAGGLRKADTGDLRLSPKFRWSGSDRGSCAAGRWVSFSPVRSAGPGPPFFAPLDSTALGRCVVFLAVEESPTIGAPHPCANSSLERRFESRLPLVRPRRRSSVYNK